MCEPCAQDYCGRCTEEVVDVVDLTVDDPADVLSESGGAGYSPTGSSAASGAALSSDGRMAREEAPADGASGAAASAADLPVVEHQTRDQIPGSVLEGGHFDDVL